jgi:hypothetical protein
LAQFGFGGVSSISTPPKAKNPILHHPAYLKDVVKETRPKIETNVKSNRPQLGVILMIVDAIVLRQ